MAENINVTTGADEITETVETTKPEQGKLYTEDELNSMLDSRISKAYEKWEKKKGEAVKQAEKLAKMNEEEKFKFELDQREKSIQEKEKQLSLMENKNEASKILVEKC